MANELYLFPTQANPNNIGLRAGADAGGGVNVTPGVGVLTLEGFAPSVAVSDHQTIAVGVGALTLTGFAPSVTASDHVTVAPGVGAVDITGFAPTVAVTANITISPASGDVVLTGYAPSVSASVTPETPPGGGGLSPIWRPAKVPAKKPLPAKPKRRPVTVSPQTANLTVRGYAPVVLVSDNQWVQPDAGSLSVEGYAPDVWATTYPDRRRVIEELLLQLV